MNWGHADSSDLVAWTDLPEAVYPDGLGRISSGSCIVDFRDTSGIQVRDGEPPVIVILVHTHGVHPQIRSI